MSYVDIEIVMLLLLLTLFFIAGFVKKWGGQKFICGINLQMSVALKGICCILILIGHFAQWRERICEPTPLAHYSGLILGNIALALFMYFSGYGLSLKKYGDGIGKIWIKRLKKVYFPLLFICFISMLFYAFIPEKFTQEQMITLRLPSYISTIHHFSFDKIGEYIVFLLGLKEWYVPCIIIFYSLYYLSLILTKNKSNNQTIVLWSLFIVYYFLAQIIWGAQQAHFYRYCWAFFLGHVHAGIVKNRKINVVAIIMLGGLMLTIIYNSTTTILAYFIALLIIVSCSIISKSYDINSRFLSFLGTISFFFYLSHYRIAHTIMVYTGLYSVLFWVIITIFVSFLLYKLYGALEKLFDKENVIK